MSHRERRRGRAGAAAAVIPALTAALAFATGCKADLPKLAGDGSVNIPCTPYADQLVAYTPAGGGSASGDAALGAPDTSTVVVDADTVLTVGFLGLGGIIDSDGADIAIHGTAVDMTSVDVYGSADSNSFVFIGSLDNDVTSLDISNSKLSLVLYVQLVGQSGSFAVDSLEALQTTCPGTPDAGTGAGQPPDAGAPDAG